MLSKGIFQVSEEAEGNAGSLAFIWGREAFSCSSLSGCTLEPMISAPLPECAEAELHQDGTLRRGPAGTCPTVSGEQPRQACKRGCGSARRQPIL